MTSQKQPAAIILENILKKSKYQNIHQPLILSLIEDELLKGRSQKETVKAVTAKLHQVGGAYFQQKPDYACWAERLKNCSGNIHSNELKALCVEMMSSHRSTRERLPILDEFFNRALESIAPVESILDLACGLNPLALAWMPVTQGAAYYGCDLFSDLAEFLNTFYAHIRRRGFFSPCDLTEMNFPSKAKVAFLLKTLPCLDQLEKGFSARILEEAPADYLLVSYPLRSLGGHAKGMGKTYENQFRELIAGTGWNVERFEFKSELAFLVKK